MSLSKRTLILTGGAKGIGRACARRAAAQGARIVIGDIDEAAGQRTAADIVDGGGEAVFCACDVGERLDVGRRVGVALGTSVRGDGAAVGTERHASLPLCTNTHWHGGCFSHARFCT